ncbi:MAG TPA: hypothetical protein VHD83_28245 [Puia sp.]|nr:hypothetical protein [Puia sp.]
MTWKKWIFSFTAICLFNTIFCFHAADVLGSSNGRPSVEEADSYAGSGTLLGFLIQQVQDDSSDQDGQAPLKLKCRHCHFTSRFLSYSVQAPQPAVYSALFIPEQTPTEYGNYQVRKACLPSYYNFLFRLNLF